MNEELSKSLENASIAETLKELIETNTFKPLNSEDLKHVDNIITGIISLKESSSFSNFYWITFLMMLFGPATNMGSFGSVPPNEEVKEDETDKPKL